MARAHSRGFTLLEMLLAIAIFSVISLSTWQMFKGIIQAKEMVTSRNQTMAELDQALLIMDRDFRQIADRGTQVDGQVSNTSLYSDSSMADSDDEAIALVRYGWANAGQQLPRSTLQRVIYRLKDNRLERQFFYVLDPVSLVDPPVTQVLLSGVDRLQFRFFYGGQWQEELPDGGEFPQGIAIAVTPKGLGTIERRYLLSAPWPVE